MLVRFFLRDIKNMTVKNHQEKLLQEMESYLNAKTCRRLLLLKHFDNNAKSELVGTKKDGNNLFYFWLTYKYILYRKLYLLNQR